MSIGSKGMPWVIGFALLAFLPPRVNAADEAADSLAKGVLDKAGVRATVCELPRAGDGTLAACGRW
jgi:hypothetical protein